MQGTIGTFFPLRARSRARSFRRLIRCTSTKMARSINSLSTCVPSRWPRSLQKSSFKDFSLRGRKQDDSGGFQRDSHADPHRAGHALRPAAVHTMPGTWLDAASPWAASMMRDIDHQAPRLEADHLVGDLIRRAQRVGVDVPLMRVAYAHLQVYDARSHQAQGPVRTLQAAAGTARPLAVDHASASASAAEKRHGKENQRMDSSRDGTRGGSRVDADAPGAWRSDEIRGTRPRAADQCPARMPSSAIQERAVTTERSGQGAPMSRINGARRATPESRSDAGAPPTTSTRFDPRTRLLLEGPIVATLLRLAAPNVLVMFVQASVGLIETYFVAKLGTDALAGVALVFPVLMLMQMMSAGAMGGGISSAIARALGAGRRAEADALVFHALAIAGGFGLLFMLVVLGSGRWLYSAMGGTGASLTAALTYSDVVFAGALLVWTFNSLASAIRGAGNMAVPAVVTCAGAVALIPLSPCLIFGWGPFPEYGIAGGAVAVIAYYAAGTLVFATYLWAGRSVVRLSFHNARLRRSLFRE